MAKKHLTSDELRAIIKHQASYHKEDAVLQASNELVPQIYGAVALAIMRDSEDDRTENERSEYIQRIFDASAGIWKEASENVKSRSYRVIFQELREKYGIELERKP